MDEEQEQDDDVLPPPSKRRTLDQSDAVMDLLPYDVQVKILSLVASNSVKDLLNLKQTCKSLHEIKSQPQDDAVSRALESLFRRSLLAILRWRIDEPSTRKLRAAAEKGHAAAKYLCGVLGRGRGVELEFPICGVLEGLRPRRPEKGGFEGLRTAVVSAVMHDKKERYGVMRKLISRLKVDESCGPCYGVSQDDELCDSCFWAAETAKLRVALTLEGSRLPETRRARVITVALRQ